MGAIAPFSYQLSEKSDRSLTERAIVFVLVVVETKVNGSFWFVFLRLMKVGWWGDRCFGQGAIAITSFYL